MVNSLQILDSGFEYPADGHVMMEGQNIALRANISDDQALAEQLEFGLGLKQLMTLTRMVK